MFRRKVRARRSVPDLIPVRSRMAAVAIGAAVTFGTGCTGDAGKPADLATLRVGAALPILQQGSTSLGYLRTSLTRDYLVSNGSDGRPNPRLLESWAASPDGLTWTVRLRRGVLFHDGSELTSADIVPSIDALRTSIFAATRLASVAAVDRFTLEVKLHERSSFFLEDLAGVFAEKRNEEERIGTGPFVVVEQSSGGASLKAFPQYYRGEPEIDRVEITTYADLRNAWTALMRNQIDLLYELNREAREFVEAESSVQVSTLLRPYVIVLGFNPSRPPLQSARIRQAISIAIDRERLVSEGLKGQGEPASSFVWPRNWAFDPDVAPTRYEPAKALAMLGNRNLDAAENGSGMPARLAFKVMVYAPLSRMALALQRQLAELDIDMQIETPNSEELVRRMATGEFDAFLFEMSGGPSLKWGYLFWHSKAQLRSSFGIKYDSADESLDKLRLASTDDEIRGAVSDFQLALANDPPAAFLAWGEIARASSRRFVVPSDGDADVYHSIWRWVPAAGGAHPNQ